MCDHGVLGVQMNSQTFVWLIDTVIVRGTRIITVSGTRNGWKRMFRVHTTPKLPELWESRIIFGILSWDCDEKPFLEHGKMQNVRIQQGVQGVTDRNIREKLLPPVGFKPQLPRGTIYAAVGPQEKIFYVGWTSRDLITRQREHLSRCQDWLGYVWEDGKPKPFAMLLHMLRRMGSEHLIQFRELQQGTREDECKLIKEKWLEGHPILNLGTPCYEFQDHCTHGSNCSRVEVDDLGCNGTILKGLAHVRYDGCPYVARWGMFGSGGSRSESGAAGHAMLFTLQTALEPWLTRNFLFDSSLYSIEIPPNSDWDRWMRSSNWLELEAWNITGKPVTCSLDWGKVQINRQADMPPHANFVIQLKHDDDSHYGYAHVYAEMVIAVMGGMGGKGARL